jgi:hypothetical protein
MKKLALMFLLSITFLSCEKNLPDVPENEIPIWLKTRISQDEQKIKENPKFMTSWGAWIRYKWQSEYYFEYNNILSSTTIVPISEKGDSLYKNANETNMKYYNEKCCKQYVWKAPNYKEY